LAATPLGYRTDHLLIAGLDVAVKPDDVAVKPDVDTTKQRIAERVLAQIVALPGVQSAALASSVQPLGSDVLAVGGKTFDARTAAHDVASQSVSPDYFQTAEVPLLTGRRFIAADRQDTVPVAIINARLAQLYFPAGDALGRQIKLGSPEDKAEQWLTVVGVVGNVKTTTVFQEMGYLTLPAVYRPLAQTPGKAGKLLLRTAAEPLGMVEKVQQAAAGANRDVVLSNIETAQGMLREQSAQPRFRTVLLGGFAGMALLLAMLGIYGLLAQQVIQRTLEIGIRMALGANRRHVVAAIVRQALGLTAVGIALGLAGSLAAGRVMAGLLYETSASDPWVLSAVTLVFVCVAAAASFLPAWRASHVEPMVAMRAE
jgi:predicted permease